MKVLNGPIKVMAIFNADGIIVPVKFRLGGQVVRIQKITKMYEEKVLGFNRIIFVCQHNGCDIYELKYELSTNTWFLFKK